MYESEYNARTTSPAKTNKYFIVKGKKYKGVKGVTNAKRISRTTNSILPNCVGYVLGCTKEKTGASIPSMNAQNFWANGKKHGWTRSQEPQVGAIICYRKNANRGHVGIVNAVGKDGSIVVSASDYGGKRFYLKKMKKPYTWSSCGKFQGFLLNPKIEKDETLEEKVARLTKENEELKAKIKELEGATK